MVVESKKGSRNYDDLEAIKDFVRISSIIEDAPSRHSQSEINAKNPQDFDKYAASSTVDENSCLIRFITVDLVTPDPEPVSREANADQDLAQSSKSAGTCDKADYKKPLAKSMLSQTRSPFKIVYSTSENSKSISKSSVSENVPLIRDSDNLGEMSSASYDPKHFVYKRPKAINIQKNVIQIGNSDIHKIKKFVSQNPPKKLTTNLKTFGISFKENDKETGRLRGRTKDEIKVNSSVAEAIEMIKGDKSVSAGKDTYVVNKFFLGPTLSTLNINDKMDLNDCKKRNIYDFVLRTGSWRKYTSSVIKVSDSRLLCYKPNSVKITNNDIKDEYFPSENDNYSYYPLDFEVDLSNSSLYVSKKMPIWKSVCCCCYSASSCLENISTMEVIKVSSCNYNYVLEVAKNDRSYYINIPNLDFIISSKGIFHSFRCTSPETFMKWLTIIQLRRLTEDRV